MNTVVVSVVTTIVSLVIAVLGAYGFSRFKFPGHGTLLMSILFTRMLLRVALLAPFYGAGSQLMFLIPLQRWMVANLEETQTAPMRAGQLAVIAVDGRDGVAFRGTVEEIAPATGSEFSVLRADNASGNFTKVAQSGAAHPGQHSPSPPTSRSSTACRRACRW